MIVHVTVFQSLVGTIEIEATKNGRYEIEKREGQLTRCILRSKLGIGSLKSFSYGLDSLPISQCKTGRCYSLSGNSKT